jgi:hypothetical protein
MMPLHQQPRGGTDAARRAGGDQPGRRSAESTGALCGNQGQWSAVLERWRQNLAPSRISWILHQSPGRQPDPARTVYAGTKPARVFISHRVGRSWPRFGAFARAGSGSRLLKNLTVLTCRRLRSRPPTPKPSWWALSLERWCKAAMGGTPGQATVGVPCGIAILLLSMSAMAPGSMRRSVLGRAPRSVGMLALPGHNPGKGLTGTMVGPLLPILPVRRSGMPPCLPVLDQPTTSTTLKRSLLVQLETRPGNSWQGGYRSHSIICRTPCSPILRLRAMSTLVSPMARSGIQLIMVKAGVVCQSSLKTFTGHWCCSRQEKRLCHSRTQQGKPCCRRIQTGRVCVFGAMCSSEHQPNAGEQQTALLGHPRESESNEKRAGPFAEGHRLNFASTSQAAFVLSAHSSSSDRLI